MTGPAAGALFLVATPIGHLGDMTLRAIETLRACDRVIAEDTRRTRHLLSHFSIAGKPVDRLDAHATARDVERILSHLLDGERVALVTDAGTPGVSDPGDALVRAALSQSLRVVPIPGPSALLAALVASGLAGDGRFRFMGFLPRDGSPRRDALALTAETAEPVILFEAPSRLQATLADFAGITPDRNACVGRELTKLHEEFVRGTCTELANDPRPWLGEIVLVLGSHIPNDRRDRIDDSAVDARIDEALAQGEHPRSVADRLAAWSGRRKRDVYERVVTRKATRSSS